MAATGTKTMADKKQSRLPIRTWNIGPKKIEWARNKVAKEIHTRQIHALFIPEQSKGLQGTVRDLTKYHQYKIQQYMQFNKGKIPNLQLV